MPTIQSKPPDLHKPSMVCLHQEPLLRNFSIAFQVVPGLEVNSEVPRELPKCKARVSLVRLSTQPSVLALCQLSLLSVRASMRRPFLPADPKEYRLMTCPVYLPRETLCSSTTLKTYTRLSNDMFRRHRRFHLLPTIKATHPRNILDSPSTISLQPKMHYKPQACRSDFSCSRWLLCRLESPMFQYLTLANPVPHVADDAELT
jgi:hypothetical protein